MGAPAPTVVEVTPSAHQAVQRVVDSLVANSTELLPGSHRGPVNTIISSSTWTFHAKSSQQLCMQSVTTPPRPFTRTPQFSPHVINCHQFYKFPLKPHLTPLHHRRMFRNSTPAFGSLGPLPPVEELDLPYPPQPGVRRLVVPGVAPLPFGPDLWGHPSWIATRQRAQPPDVVKVPRPQNFIPSLVICSLCSPR